LEPCNQARNTRRFTSMQRKMRAEVEEEPIPRPIAI